MRRTALLCALLATLLVAGACGSHGPPAGMGRVEGHLEVGKAAARSHPGLLIVRFRREKPRWGEDLSAVDSDGHFEADAFPGTYNVIVMDHAGKNLSGGTPAGPTCPSTVRFFKDKVTQVSLSWPATDCS